VSIRDLRTFLAVAETGSFAAASRSVRRTQSAVTIQMKSLEDEFGVALFDRTHRPPSLTATGRAFLERAVEAVEAYDRLYQVGSDAQVEGHLRLGVVPSVITGIMPKALTILRARYPAVHIELLMGLSKDLVGRVDAGALDAAIVSQFRKSKAGLTWSPFAEEPLVLIAPLGAAGRRAEDLIAAYPFIRYSRQTWVGEAIDAFIRRKRIKVRETMVLDTLEAVTAMVQNGLGVSIVPLRASDAQVGRQVRIVRFVGPAARRVIGVIEPASHPKKALVDVLLQALKSASRPGTSAERAARTW
jgi:DNA-binding transcriptional LysR family regulator